MKLFRGMTCPATVLIVIAFGFGIASADAPDLPHPSTYMTTSNGVEVFRHKKPYDDPTSLYEVYPLDKVLPKKLYDWLSYDMEKMKDAWAEVVGFRSPDVVGKIAPEVTPGKYTYEDIERIPGLKELIFPKMREHFKPGEPPFAGNIAEFEIVPTKQKYWSMPIIEATKKYQGTAKLDKEGYFLPETYEGGYPFPTPEGEFMAQKLIYNTKVHYLHWGMNQKLYVRVKGYNKARNVDYDGYTYTEGARLLGRVFVPPYGAIDERAKQKGEWRLEFGVITAPRDVYGTGFLYLYSLRADLLDQVLIYLPSLRRYRKMSTTDTQDPIMGLDQIYDDNYGLAQKLSPKHFPYTYEVVGEREFLVPYAGGTEYITSETFEMKNMKMERRPCYIVQLNQQDSNYVYGRRVYYIDKELLTIAFVENYNQKQALYRTSVFLNHFYPDMGALVQSWMLLRDHIDLHSTISDYFVVPGFFERKEVSMRSMSRFGK